VENLDADKKPRKLKENKLVHKTPRVQRQHIDAKTGGHIAKLHASNTYLHGFNYSFLSSFPVARQ
jgi:hypothetical protein